MSKNGLQKLQKWSFLTKKDSFLKKNTDKIETNSPGDLKLRSKQPLKYPLHDQKCFQIFFFKKVMVQRASTFDKGPKKSLRNSACCYSWSRK